MNIKEMIMNESEKLERYEEEILREKASLERRLYEFDDQLEEVYLRQREIEEYLKLDELKNDRDYWKYEASGHEADVARRQKQLSDDMNEKVTTLTRNLSKAMFSTEEKS